MKKFLQTLMLVAAMCLPWAMRAQVSGYQFSTGVDATQWIELSDNAVSFTGPTSGTGDSYASSLCNIGFTFNFGGTVYTQFSMNSDGNLRLGATVTGTSNYSSPFGGTNANANAPKINGMGRDGKMYSGSGPSTAVGAYMKYETVGTAPNRVLVAEFANLSYSSPYTLVHYQVQLYEGTNQVKLVYGEAPTTTCSSNYQIGMCTDATDVITIDVANNAAVVGAVSNSTTYYPEEGRYYQFDVPSCAAPSNVAASNVAGTSAIISWNNGVSLNPETTLSM